MKQKNGRLISATELVMPDYIDQLMEDIFPLDYEKTIEILKHAVNELKGTKILSQEIRDTYSAPVREIYDAICSLPNNLIATDKEIKKCSLKEVTADVVISLKSTISSLENILQKIKTGEFYDEVEQETYAYHVKYFNAKDAESKKNLISAHKEYQKAEFKKIKEQAQAANNIAQQQPIIVTKLIVRMGIVTQEQLHLVNDSQLELFELNLKNHNFDSDRLRLIFDIAKNYYENDQEKGLRLLAEIPFDYIPNLLNNKMLHELLQSKHISLEDLVHYSSFFTFNLHTLELAEDFEVLKECIALLRKNPVNEAEIVKTIIDNVKDRLSIPNYIYLLANFQKAFSILFNPEKYKLPASDFKFVLTRYSVDNNLELFKIVLKEWEKVATESDYLDLLYFKDILKNPEAVKLIVEASKDKLTANEVIKFIIDCPFTKYIDSFKIILSVATEKFSVTDFFTLLKNNFTIEHRPLFNIVLHNIKEKFTISDYQSIGAMIFARENSNIRSKLILHILDAQFKLEESLSSVLTGIHRVTGLNVHPVILAAVSIGTVNACVLMYNKSAILNCISYVNYNNVAAVAHTGASYLYNSIGIAYEFSGQLCSTAINSATAILEPVSIISITTALAAITAARLYNQRFEEGIAR